MIGGVGGGGSPAMEAKRAAWRCGVGLPPIKADPDNALVPNRVVQLEAEVAEAKRDAKAYRNMYRSSDGEATSLRAQVDRLTTDNATLAARVEALEDERDGWGPAADRREKARCSQEVMPTTTVFGPVWTVQRRSPSPSGSGFSCAGMTFGSRDECDKFASECRRVPDYDLIEIERLDPGATGRVVETAWARNLGEGRFSWIRKDKPPYPGGAVIPQALLPDTSGMSPDERRDFMVQHLEAIAAATQADAMTVSGTTSPASEPGMVDWFIPNDQTTFAPIPLPTAAPLPVTALRTVSDDGLRVPGKAGFW